MNIKITKEQANFINTHKMSTRIIGSKLYKTAKDNSDTDYLIIYDSFHKSDLYYPNYHQFQYDDVQYNRQYIYTSHNQFWKNLFSGDSTINTDTILFYDDYNPQEKLNICSTYNIIKSFIGFAKRDLKSFKQGKGKNKLFHAERSLYCAEELIKERLPSIDYISSIPISSLNYQDLYELEEYLRQECNKMFQEGSLTMYPKENVCPALNELEQLLIDSNNTKEFKYA